MSLQRKHRDIYLTLKTEPSSSNKQQPSMEEFTKKSSKFERNDPRQIQITDLVSFIAGDLLPLATAESPSFRNLLEKCEPRYQVPARKFFFYKTVG